MFKKTVDELSDNTAPPLTPLLPHNPESALPNDVLKANIEKEKNKQNEGETEYEYEEEEEEEEVSQNRASFADYAS